MNILITGGAGFIGSHLSRALAREGHEVAILDSLITQVHGDDSVRESATHALAASSARMVRGDVRDPGVLRELLQDAEIVVHLAAETGTGQSMTEVERHVDVNVRGTSVMLQELGSGFGNVRKLVLASSRVVYGEGKYLSRSLGIVYPGPRNSRAMADGDFEVRCPATGEVMEPLPTDEDSVLQPVSVYGVTKLAQEHLAKVVCAKAGIALTVLRYQNVYGPGQSMLNPYTGILPVFAQAIRAGSEVSIYEDGNESRDLLYIDDAVGAVVRVIGSTTADGRIYNVGSGERTSVMEIATRLKQDLGGNALLRVTGEFRAGDIRHNYADICRIRGELGYAPVVGIDEGIRRFAAWVRQQPPVPASANDLGSSWSGPKRLP